MSITAARRVALEVLLSVDVDDAYANIRLPEVLRKAQLPNRDAAFATELVYGTCRLTGRYDAIIRQATGKKSVASLDAPVRAILRMSCHDLLTLKTGAHATVSQAVDATRSFGASRSAGFVNAVLRSIADKTPEQWRSDILHGHDGLAHWYSHPAWMVRELSAALAAHGRNPREIIDLLIADNTPPAIDLAIRRGDRGALLAEVPFDLAATPYSPIGMRMRSGNPGRIREVRSGAVAVQDEGSQIMGLIAANAPLEGRDERWLDMCAGPGGKSGILAAQAARRGAHVVANEVSRHRSELVRSSVRVFDNVTVTCRDGRGIGREEGGQYDRVLVDAPCSGLGALRRRPEARWRKKVGDISDLVTLQRELLASAAAALRPGGLLIYVTCTPVVSETAGQSRYIHKSLGLTPCAVDVAAILGASVPEMGETSLQLWPHLHHTDAMFAAVFRR